MDNIILEKLVWTEEDFEKMGWHDCKVYAMAFPDDEKFELAFDIDYIVKWVNLKEDNTYIKFWVAPATLVFKNVYEININLYTVDFQIQDINRENPIKPKNKDHIKDILEYDWRIETTNGEITFKSVGYTQFIRQKPKLLDKQLLDFNERGGITFDRMVN